MADSEFVEFMQWALPQMQMRWRGFRRVRSQVGKRIRRRLVELNLGNISDYRTYLSAHPGEWGILDGLTRITISRFYRDRDVFDRLRDGVIPDLARAALADRAESINVWSAGCASYLWAPFAANIVAAEDTDSTGR